MSTPAEPAQAPAPLSALSMQDFLHLSVRPKKVQPLDLPGLGRAYLRVLSGAERDLWESGNYEWDAKSGRSRMTFRNCRARLAALALCDEHGSRLFRDGHADQLGQMDSTVLDQIYEAASKLSRLTRETVEDAEKNSPSANGSSGSGSPAISE